MSTDMFAYVVHLLETYRSIQQRIAVLRYELSHPSNILPDEMLGALAYPKQGSGIRSSAGHISDKTFYIAMNYHEKAEALNRENAASFSVQLVKLEQKAARLEHCVSQLPAAQAAVIRGIYFHGHSLKELAAELHISERTVQRYRNSGVLALVEMYETLVGANIPLE